LRSTFVDFHFLLLVRVFGVLATTQLVRLDVGQRLGFRLVVAQRDLSDRLKLRLEVLQVV